MNIRSIQLANFSSHAATTLDFKEKVTILTGAMNSGKSSLVQAIEYVLTGQLEHYRGARSPVKEVIRAGEGGCSVKAVLELAPSVGGHAKRVKSTDGPETFTWGEDVGLPAEAAMMAALKIRKPGVLNALMNTGDFFELDPKDQKELILSIIGAEVKNAEVRKLFQGEADALKLVSVDLDSVQAIDAVYKQVYDERTVVNRELKELLAVKPPDGEEPPMDRIKSRIKELEDQKSEVQKELGGAIERVKAATVDTKRQGLQERLDKATKWLEANPDVNKAELEHVAKVLDECTKTLYQAGLDREKYVNEATQNKIAMGVHESNMKTLKAFKGKCVAGDHDCPVPAAEMEKAKKIQMDLYYECTVTEERLKQAHFAVEASVKSSQTKLEEAQRSLKSKQAVVDERTSQLQHKGMLEAELNIAGEPQGPPKELTDAVEALKLHIAELNARIEKGNLQRDAATKWVTYRDQYNFGIERRKTLETKKRHLEALIDFLGPAGVKIQLIDAKLSGFLGLVTTALNKFGFEFSFQVNPWAISAKGRPINRLSRSERFRLGIAIQVGIAQVTGLRFIIVDNAEILTSEARAQMLGLCSEALDQAIIAMTTMKPEEQFLAQVPKIPGVQFCFVRNKQGVSEVQAL